MKQHLFLPFYHSDMLSWVKDEIKRLHLPTMHTSKSCGKMDDMEEKPKSAKAPSTEFPPPGYRPTPVNKLLVNALDLTVPASDVVLNTRKNAWVQVAGHPGSFAPASQNTIWKKRQSKDNHETSAYHALMNDVVKNIVPRFHREVEYNGETFIEIEDLLQHFTNPSIMDIKMGTRTFLESEVRNQKLRADLYQKMIKINPDEPTPEEHNQKAITKLRYMQFRERDSSTSSLGFRVEAIKMSDEKPNTDLKTIKTEAQVKQVLSEFLQYNKSIQLKLLKRFKEMRQKIESSKFFKHHEVIGSSILVLYDDKEASAWMIDFAKTLRLDNGTINHRTPWQLGNHEDGYLIGVDNLIRIFSELDFDQHEQNSFDSTVRSDTSALNITQEINNCSQVLGTDCLNSMIHMHNDFTALPCQLSKSTTSEQCLPQECFTNCSDGSIFKPGHEFRATPNHDFNQIGLPQIHVQKT